MAVERILAELDTVRQGCFSDEEFNGAARRASTDLLRSLQTSHEMASLLAKGLLFGFDERLPLLWPSTKAIAPAAMRQFAGEFLRREQCTMILTGPAEALRRSLPEASVIAAGAWRAVLYTGDEGAAGVQPGGPFRP